MSALNHKIFNITIAGSGNVAWHLSHAFKSKGHTIDRIIARNESTGKKLADEINAQFISDFETSNDSSDVVVLAINDSSLNEVLHKINTDNTIMLHTSGSVGLEFFNGKAGNYGVFYPFQTLTAGVEVDFSSIPICIEASDDKTLSVIRELAETIASHIHILDSAKRRILHLAGIMTNNFINHFIARSFDYLKRNSIETDLLLPLLKETLLKLEKVSAKEAQTGPARRKNPEIIEVHKKMLESEPELKKLYSLISDSIIAYYS